jgi:hypothetical protein
MFVSEFSRLATALQPAQDKPQLSLMECAASAIAAHITLRYGIYRCSLYDLRSEGWSTGSVVHPVKMDKAAATPPPSRMNWKRAATLAEILLAAL